MSTDVTGKVEASWQGLMDALEGIPEERMSEPGVVGVWSVKDTMAHIAFWDDLSTAYLDHLTTGHELERVDWREVNDRVARERADWSLERARQELDQAHARVLTAVRATPRSKIDDEALAGNTYGHYDEHAAEIRDWREREGL